MKIQLSKSQWEHIGKVAGWTKESQQATQSPQPVANPQQQDQLDSLIGKLIEMDSRMASPILDAIYGTGALNSLKNFFLRDKLQKYKSYTPEQRKQYADRFAKALGNAYVY